MHDTSCTQVVHVAYVSVWCSQLDQLTFGEELVKLARGGRLRGSGRGRGSGSVTSFGERGGSMVEPSGKGGGKGKGGRGGGGKGGSGKGKGSSKGGSKGGTDESDKFGKGSGKGKGGGRFGTRRSDGEDGADGDRSATGKGGAPEQRNKDLETFGNMALHSDYRSGGRVPLPPQPQSA